MPEFLGLDCVELKSDALSLLITKSVGPRILSLRFREGENLFAEVPDFTLDCPGAGKCHLWGGHRLWVAPEEPHVTYLPDESPMSIEAIPGGLKVVQPVEPRTGIQKEMSVSIPSTILVHSLGSSEGRSDSVKSDPFGEVAIVLIDHTIRNCSSVTVSASPWAITQLKPCGFAILPHTSRGSAAGGSWKRRGMVLWPYTNHSDSRIGRGDDYTFIQSRLEGGALKVGYANYNEWLAYFREGTVFTKLASFDPEASYCDQGSSSECYCNDRFLELETLGPTRAISPGEEVFHRETWFVRDGISLTPSSAGVRLLNLPEWDFV